MLFANTVHLSSSPSHTSAIPKFSVSVLLTVDHPENFRVMSTKEGGSFATATFINPALHLHVNNTMELLGVVCLLYKSSG